MLMGAMVTKKNDQKLAPKSEEPQDPVEQMWAYFRDPEQTEPIKINGTWVAKALPDEQMLDEEENGILPEKRTLEERNSMLQLCHLTMFIGEPLSEDQALFLMDAIERELAGKQPFPYKRGRKERGYQEKGLYRAIKQRVTEIILEPLVVKYAKRVADNPRQGRISAEDRSYLLEVFLDQPDDEVLALTNKIPWHLAYVFNANERTIRNWEREEEGLQVEMSCPTDGWDFAGPAADAIYADIRVKGIDTLDELAAYIADGNWKKINPF
ncbi:hypothetical protein FCL40_07205 [Ferrimonas sediminicola]|uniref:Uncharacterized protein n=1 Tax=Ferrimonas sediminicola TaxID=2569538 RepID=A0A4U1BFN3_9GAMM|nr:hypothetical protein [Ferrimonas sediminicola]TKB49931.1 hypothetical protein FCL40_07205 [Ferrimonas sediminicola]